MWGRVLLLGVMMAAHPALAQSVGSEELQKDLSGYWQYGEDRILYVTQDGQTLTSRHTKRTVRHAHYADEIDFTATVLDDLVHGAHLIRLPWPMHRTCPVDMWVGIGLTLNEEQTILTGYRGHRTVDLATCEVRTEAPRAFVYRRMMGDDGKPLR